MTIRKYFRAFTLVELMTVVLIIGIIAAFGIPNFQRAINKGYEREAILILKTIHSANEVFRIQRGNNGSYWPGGGDLTAIGPGLGISLSTSQDRVIYLYTPSGCAGAPIVCSGYQITATLPGFFEITLDQDALQESTDPALTCNPLSCNPWCSTPVGTCRIAGRP